MASVGGQGGRNMPPDVVTVQQLLNQVPNAQGGPFPPLISDGLCGPKTVAAIQSFQLAHFGWKGADSRVDPNGPTLAKLNEFDPFPPLTTASVLRCLHGGTIITPQVVAGLKDRLIFKGSPVLKATDTFVVAGCPFAVGGPSPCLGARWVGGPSDPLDRRSIGLCLSVAQAPQGPVVIVKV